MEKNTLGIIDLKFVRTHEFFKSFEGKTLKILKGRKAVTTIHGLADYSWHIDVKFDQTAEYHSSFIVLHGNDGNEYELGVHDGFTIREKGKDELYCITDLNEVEAFVVVYSKKDMKKCAKRQQDLISREWDAKHDNLDYVLVRSIRSQRPKSKKFVAEGNTTISFIPFTRYEMRKDKFKKFTLKWKFIKEVLLDLESKGWEIEFEKGLDWGEDLQQIIDHNKGFTRLDKIETYLKAETDKDVLQNIIITLTPPNSTHHITFWYDESVSIPEGIDKDVEFLFKSIILQKGNEVLETEKVI